MLSGREKELGAGSKRSQGWKVQVHGGTVMTVPSMLIRPWRPGNLKTILRPALPWNLGSVATHRPWEGGRGRKAEGGCRVGEYQSVQSPFENKSHKNFTSNTSGFWHL